MGLAIIAYFVEEMSTVLIVMPTLVFMLTLSAAVHLVSYYRDVGGARSRLSGVRAPRLWEQDLHAGRADDGLWFWLARR